MHEVRAPPCLVFHWMCLLLRKEIFTTDLSCKPRSCTGIYAGLGVVGELCTRSVLSTSCACFNSEARETWTMVITRLKWNLLYLSCRQLIVKKIKTRITAVQTRAAGLKARVVSTSQVLPTFFWHLFFFKYKLVLELTQMSLVKADEAVAF